MPFDRSRADIKTAFISRGCVKIVRATRVKRKNLRLYFFSFFFFPRYGRAPNGDDKMLVVRIGDNGVRTAVPEKKA